MAKRMLALAVVLAVLAAGCAGSPEVESVGSRDNGTATALPEREVVDAVEPSPVSGAEEPAALPTPLVDDEPATTPTEPPQDDSDVSPDETEADSSGDSQEESSDDLEEESEVVISPEAPLPARWLCTFDVEEAEELNLRASPGLDAPIVFGIPGGSCRMRALAAAEDGWVKVAYTTQTISAVGYVSTEFADEDPVRTIALNWFERVVAEQDTSEVAVQELVDDSTAINPFPPAASRVVPFDFGSPLDCISLGGVPDISGCPVHVLDGAGALVTPMVIQTQVTAVRGGEPQVRVTGFVLCIGTEDCPNFDVSLHSRIVVDDSMTLAGVEVGTDAEEAIEELKGVFADPTEDSGWVVGCPLDGQSDVNERYVSWGSLTAGFRQGDSTEPDQYFHYWSYRLDENRMADPDGPQPWEVQLPSAATLGMNMTTAASYAPGELFVNEVLQVQQLRTDAWNFYGQGIEEDTRINSIGVPFVPLCD